MKLAGHVLAGAFILAAVAMVVGSAATQRWISNLTGLMASLITELLVP